MVIFGVEIAPQLRINLQLGTVPDRCPWKTLIPEILRVLQFSPAFGSESAENQMKAIILNLWLY